jgi:hypothetical protein
VSDNAPPVVVGSGFRIYRANTASATWADTAIAPASFFDNTYENSADWIINLANGSVQVANAGWYNFTARIKSSSNISNEPSMLLYRNGANPLYGASLYFSLSLAASWTIYLNAGDSVQVGQAGGGNLSMVGEPTGLQSYFTGALMNWSLN